MPITLFSEATNGGKGPFTNAVPHAWTGFSGTIQPAVGDIILVWATFDNVTATTPTITSIGKPSGETNSWVMLASHDSPQSGSAAGVRGELWGIQVSTTDDWASTLPIATTAASTGAAVTLCQTFSGASLNLRGSAGSGTTSASCSPSSGDLVIGAGSAEGNTTLTGDSDTTNGSWSTILTRATSGGGAASNVASGMQYKVVSATGSQTYNPSPTTDGGVIAVALQPAGVPPKVGSGSGSFAFAGSAAGVNSTGGGSGLGTASWSSSATGVAPLEPPTFRHWMTANTGPTTGVMELHIEAESFARTVELQRRLSSAGDETFTTVLTEAATAGQEYVAVDDSVAQGAFYVYRARQSVTSPSAQTSNWATFNRVIQQSSRVGGSGSGWLPVFRDVSDNVTYGPITGVVNISGDDHWFIGNGYTETATRPAWFEGRNLHLEQDYTNTTDGTYLDSISNNMMGRYNTVDCGNKTYVVGPSVTSDGSYVTTVYSFNGSDWSSAGNPTMPTAQAWVAAVIGTKIYAAGANKTLYVWDTAGASSWTALTYSGTSAPVWLGAVAGKLYLYCADGSFKSYDPATTTWTTGLTPPSSPYDGTKASRPLGVDDHGRLYLYGGTSSSTSFSDALWQYDVDADAWSQNMTVGNGGAEAGFAWSPHFEAFIVGGYRTSDISGNVLTGGATPFMFRPLPPGGVGSASGTASWSATASGVTARSGSGAGAVAWVGTASAPGLQQGSSSGAMAWSGSAAGVRQPEGAASTGDTWTTAASGVTQRSGLAVAAVTWACIGDGYAPMSISAGAVTSARSHSKAQLTRFFR